MRIARALSGLAAAGLIAGLGIAVARADTAPQPPAYVRFDPLILPVYVDQQAGGLLAIRLTVEATDPQARARLEALRPRLVDGWTVALVDHARIAVEPASALDVAGLAAISDGVARRIGGTDVARVLVVDVAARPVA